MKHFKTLLLIALFTFSCGFVLKANPAYATGCTTGTIDSNQQGMTIVGNCPTNVRLIGVPADNNVFYSDCIQQWGLGTDFTWQWNPLPVCGGWHGGASQTFWFFSPQGQSYDCHDLASCEGSATDGFFLLHRIGGVWSFMPTGPTITITRPTNASTQTDKNTQLTGAWDDIDPNLYEDSAFTLLIPATALPLPQQEKFYRLPQAVVLFLFRSLTLILTTMVIGC